MPVAHAHPGHAEAVHAIDRRPASSYWDEALPATPSTRGHLIRFGRCARPYWHRDYARVDRAAWTGCQWIEMSSCHTPYKML